MNISLEIATELKHLEIESKQKKWIDAPHALVEIRNSLVHPDHKQSGGFDIHTYSEAHTLTLWYIEVSILAICKFNNLYSNRVKNGLVEEVPYKI